MARRAFLARRVRRAKSLKTAAAVRFAQNSHPVLHVLRHAVVANDRPRVAQAATFALNHKAPQRVACFLDELRPYVVGLLLAPIVVGKRGERRFKRAS